MNRYQRRKRALKRKEARADMLLSRAIIRKQQILKEALKDARLRAELLARDDLSSQERALLSFRKREPFARGLRSSCGVFHGGQGDRGLFLKGYGTGAFTEQPQSERTLREIRSGEKKDC